MIIYTCPKCGEELEQIILPSLPPIHVTRCNKCGFKEEKREELQRVVYKPLILNAN